LQEVLDEFLPIEQLVFFFDVKSLSAVEERGMEGRKRGA
jgi:hypothetical protein